MAASYPTSAKSFTTKTTDETVEASHVNELQDEVTAIETALVSSGVAHNVFPSGSRTLGTSSAFWNTGYLTALVLGAATTSGIRLEVNGGICDVSEGDDSALAALRALRLMGRTAASFSPVIATDTGDGLALGNGGTPGSGVYGAGISFAPVGGLASTRRAAIAAKQMAADSDQVGVSIFTHTSSTATDDMVEAAVFHAGLTIGTPTGGDKGAGTLNCVGAYDDNVLLTDWALDLHYAGVTTHRLPAWAAEDAVLQSGRLYTLAETMAVASDARRLPWMPTRDDFEQERNLGGMISRLWFGQEQQQVYLGQLQQTIDVLRAKVGAV